MNLPPAVGARKSEPGKKRTRKTEAPAANTAGARRTTAAKTRACAPSAVALSTASNAPEVDPPRALEKALGAQVRLLRRERDLSVVDLAHAADISIGMMSKIENGQISPSLSTINALAHALHVPLTSLFHVFEDKRDCSYVAKGEGLNIERRGTKSGHVYEMLGAVLGGEVNVEPFLITLKDDAAPYTSFRHTGVEIIYMLTGRVVYRHADQTYTLTPGDTLVFDSGAMHGPERLLRVPSTYLSIIVYPRPAADRFRQLTGSAKKRPSKKAEPKVSL